MWIGATRASTEASGGCLVPLDTIGEGCVGWKNPIPMHTYMGVGGIPMR